ncbi:MAG: phage tail length tape measure family protein [Rhodospirillaceae bacterium]
MVGLPDLRFDIVANDQTAAAFDAVRAANDRMTASVARADTQMSGTLRQANAAATQLSFQLNDITQGLLMGQSPFQVMIQQGSQVAQVFGQTGVRSIGGTLALLKQSFLSLVNPVSLATFAVIGLGGAAISWLGNAFGSTEDLKDITDRHTESVKALRDAYGEARDAQEGLTEAERLDRLFQAQSDLRDVMRQVAAQSRTLETDLVFGWLNDLGNTAPINALEAAINDFYDGLRLGAPDVAGFREQLNRIGATTDDARVDDLVRQLLDLTDPLGENANLASDLAAEIAVLTGNATEEQLAQIGVAGATEHLNDVLKEHSELLRDGGRAAGEFLAGSSAMQEFMLRQSIGRLTELFDAELINVRDQLSARIAEAVSNPDLREAARSLREPFNELFAGIAAGAPDLEAFREQVAEFANLHAEDAELRAWAASLLAATETAATMSGALAQGGAAIKALGAAGEVSKPGVDAFNSALAQMRALFEIPLEGEALARHIYEVGKAAATTTAEIVKLNAQYEAALGRLKESAPPPAPSGGGGAAIREETDAVAELIERLQQEAQLLGLSAVEQEVMNNLRLAGAAATEEQRAAIEALTRANYEQEESLKRLEAAADFAGQTLYTMFERVIIEGDSFKEVLADVLKLLAQVVLQAVLLGKGPLAGLFGGVGLFPALFGGKRASGGPVEAGAIYEVGERGREWFIPSVSGRIVPGDGVGGAITIAPVYQIDARGASSEVAGLIQSALEQNNRQLRRALPGWIDDARRRGAIR